MALKGSCGKDGRMWKRVGLYVRSSALMPTQGTRADDRTIPSRDKKSYRGEMLIGRFKMAEVGSKEDATYRHPSLRNKCPIIDIDSWVRFRDGELK